eukprot:4116458-Prymnesium_polylepis.2
MRLARADLVVGEVEVLQRGEAEELRQDLQLVERQVEQLEPRQVVQLDGRELVVLEAQVGHVLEAAKRRAHLDQLVVGEVELADGAERDIEQRAQPRQLEQRVVEVQVRARRQLRQLLDRPLHEADRLQVLQQHLLRQLVDDLGGLEEAVALLPLLLRLRRRELRQLERQHHLHVAAAPALGKVLELVEHALERLLLADGRAVDLEQLAAAARRQAVLVLATRRRLDDAHQDAVLVDVEPAALLWRRVDLHHLRLHLRDGAILDIALLGWHGSDRTAVRNEDGRTRATVAKRSAAKALHPAKALFAQSQPGMVSAPPVTFPYCGTLFEAKSESSHITPVPAAPSSDSVDVPTSYLAAASTGGAPPSEHAPLWQAATAASIVHSSDDLI